jgi:16S rRNA (adenine(1408)-N(1))-methyltransferase
MPWGSLLRGALGEDDEVLAGIARLLTPRATAVVLLSVPAPQRTRLDAAYVRNGLRLLDLREATADEVAASGSSWAKRLRAPITRPVNRLELALR